MPVQLRYHLEDQGYVSAQNAQIVNLGSELATTLPLGSGSIAQVSLDTNGSLTINASDMNAASALAKLLPINTMKASNSGDIQFIDNQGNTTVFTQALLIPPLSTLTFPGATLIRDI